MVRFSGNLGTGQVEDWKIMKGKLIDGKKIVSRLAGKLVKMVEDAGSKFDLLFNFASDQADFIALGL